VSALVAVTCAQAYSCFCLIVTATSTACEWTHAIVMHEDSGKSVGCYATVHSVAVHRDSAARGHGSSSSENEHRHSNTSIHHVYRVYTFVVGVCCVFVMCCCGPIAFTR
jgi:hypothetical protein